MTEASCVSLTTTGSREEAQRIAETLVSRRLAACVQIAGISSTYRWKGKVTSEPEHLLLIKTASRLYKDIESAIQELHSYEIPEIVQLPIEQGLGRYLAWIEESTGSGL
jgi:periplasmic divalent cation tolerance protein